MAITMGKLLLMALLLAAATAGIYRLDRRGFFGPGRQWIIGALFGCFAVLSTEWGVDIGGATANIRDASPLIAGLLFGAPAGLLAGVIGGVERWFAALWGAGMYTRLACSLSTVLAGVAAAALRRHMFDDKKPSWAAGLCVGLVMEVLHMLLIFLTNMVDVHAAFRAVELCAGPMILANGAAVLLAVLAVTWLSGERDRVAIKRRDIAQRFQSWLLICVAAAFLCTCAFTFALQTKLSRTDADDLMRLNIADVKADVEDASDANILRLAHKIANFVSIAYKVDNDTLAALADQLDVPEIDLVDASGIITLSTNPSFIGYDMASGAQSSEFLGLLDGQKEYVQSYQPISYDASLSRKYAGVALPSGGFVQVGYDAEHFQSDIAIQVAGATRNRHVSETGAMIICDENWLIVSDPQGHEGQNLAVTGVWLDESAVPQGERFEADVYGEPSLCVYGKAEGYRIIAFLPKKEALLNRNLSLYVMAFMEIVLFAAVFTQIYFLIKRVIVDNIHSINASLARITGGDLSVTVDVRSSEEFASLSDDINSTVQTLKRYISEAEKRIDRELAFAKAIQHSSLPSVFPPFPDHLEFDLYATMETAKEVGGDFYDFYFVGEDRLAFLVADVSGKGIPAALFMMRAKTQLKSLMETGVSLAEAFCRANESLCQSNDAGMFVTAWLGALNIRTGLVEYVNAGHNPPIVKRANGEATYLKSRPGFVLAGMEGVSYRAATVQLAPGDMLFLYTDGITEATDKREALFGEDRLLDTLLGEAFAAPKDALLTVQRAVSGFVGDAPQFDDMTMLALAYRGPKEPLKEWNGAPTLEALPQAAAFVEDTLNDSGCPLKTVIKMNVAMDEVFSNIARYSNAKNASVACGVEDGMAVLRFRDDGKPYDPTAQPDPDVGLSADEREMGGLGMYMVKKTMDFVEYSYQSGWNALCLKRALD